MDKEEAQELAESLKIYAKLEEEFIDWFCSKCNSKGYVHDNIMGIYVCNNCGGTTRIKISKEEVFQKLIKFYGFTGCLKEEEFYDGFCPCEECLPATLERLKNEPDESSEREEEVIIERLGIKKKHVWETSEGDFPIDCLHYSKELEK